MLSEPIPAAALGRLFSIVMVLDRELRIQSSSDALLRYLPSVAGAPALLELFEIRRPAGIRTFEDIRSNSGPLYFLLARDGSFAVRGQFISLETAGGERLCFLGSPWLSWLQDHNPELEISLDDFAPQDAQVDQLFYISTEKQMVRDLENLNEELQKTTEQLKAAQQAKSAFFAQMSHELRTPLNGVVSALALLREQGLGGQAKTLMDLAAESSRNLMHVINYVLDVSKLELSQPSSEEIPFDLPELVASVISTVQAKAMEKGLALYSQVDSRLSSSYVADSSLLRQCLLNLVTNAIKFTDEGEVSVRVAPASGEGMTVRIEVNDTGIGIEPENLDRVFEPFHSAGGSGPVDRGPGTGLGLDIVRRNVRHMGGDVGVSSTPGEGSRFWLELPCRPDHSAADAQRGDAPDTEERRNLKGRILLVDDNRTNLMLGEMILQSIGLDVVTADSGEAAVSAAENDDPELVLMDINMPGIDGFEATRRIRAFRDAEALPVIALTAYASSIEREKSVECGMNGYLTKPIDAQEIRTTLSSWLSWSDDLPAAPKNAEDDAEGAVVDRTVLDKLASQIGADNLKNVVDAFLEEIDWRWPALEKAESSEDMARQAHTLASGCRSFGLPAMGEKIACIERHIKHGGEGDEPPCIRSTGMELFSAAEALKAVIAQYPAGD